MINGLPLDSTPALLKSAQTSLAKATPTDFFCNRQRNTGWGNNIITYTKVNL